MVDEMVLYGLFVQSLPAAMRARLSSGLAKKSHVLNVFMVLIIFPHRFIDILANVALNFLLGKSLTATVLLFTLEFKVNDLVLHEYWKWHCALLGFNLAARTSDIIHLVVMAYLSTLTVMSGNFFYTNFTEKFGAVIAHFSWKSHNT